MKKQKVKKKRYEEPKVVSEKVYEINALKCGKCQAGPFHQRACARLGKSS